MWEHFCQVLTQMLERGGLPVRGGAEIVNIALRRIHQLFPFENRFATCDQHERGGVSWHTSFFGYAPKSVLTVQEVRLWTPQNHRIAPHARFDLPQLVDYLEQLESLTPGGGIQVLWDEHADKDKLEGHLHPDLPAGIYSFVQYKGLDPICDSYSGVKDNLGRLLELPVRIERRGARRVFVYGLAWDFCVRWTALNLAQLGYEVYIILDATAAVDLPGNDKVAGSVAKTMVELAAAGVQFTTTDRMRLVTKPF
jgi:nicotinamidase-related amidase